MNDAALQEGRSALHCVFKKRAFANTALTPPEPVKNCWFLRLREELGLVAPPAPRDAASRDPQVRRFQPARLPGHLQRRGPQRDRPARPGTVPGAQPGGQRARCQRAATLRGPLPPDHGLYRSVQARGAPVELDGRSTPDLSAMYTTNSAMHTAFVEVSLK